MKKEEITIKDIFNYVGQRKKEYTGSSFVLYASTNHDVAWGYASSCAGSGYIHKFMVTRDITLLQGDVYEEAEEVEKCICDKGYDGFVVIYATLPIQHDEYALCNSSSYLEYISSVKCVGQNKVEDVSLDDYSYDVITGLDLYNLTTQEN